MEKKLYSYSIMDLDLNHIDEICADIKRQYEEGISDCVLFEMTLVPEGNPPSDKVGILCKKFKIFQERLAKENLTCGVLVQASVGHGWVLGEMFPYQTHVNFNNGVATRVVCPCDDGFKEYIYNVMATIAKCNPECIMVDDDFRLIWYKGDGCACPMHMERFNKLAGTNITREELWEIVNQKTPLAKKYTDLFIQTQRESLVETAKSMRAGIDSVNPYLPASYCCCGNNAEFAYEIANELKGKGNPVVVRINNGNYTPEGARYLSRVFQRCATQVEKLKGKVDYLLAETDTCPQNRYSTSAMSLHSHYTGSILEGANGAKHWITRLITHEPKSGEAYRRVLGKNRGFYERLAELVPTLKWRGCRIFVPSEPNFDYTRVKEEWDGWSFSVLERLGLPVYFSSKITGVTFLEGDSDSVISDSDILEILKGTVVLASDTAKNLIDRGFGKYLGVDIREWRGKIPVREKLCLNGAFTPIQRKAKEIVINSPETVAYSYVCNTTDYESYEELFPGSTMYKNSLGGTVIVFCGSPVANFNIVEAFSFLNYSRKEQLISMLRDSGELLVYYPGDEEVYFKCAEAKDNEVMIALFNTGFDIIENIELVCDFEAKAFKKLLPDGSTKKVDFKNENGKYILNENAITLDPVVIFIER